MRPDGIVIIGAGPAGMAAAIQLKRSDLPFVLIERERVGGLLWNANLVENYPGFPAGVAGPRLVQLFEKHMRRVGVDVVFDEVISLTPQPDGMAVMTNRATYLPRFIIAATGTRPIPPWMDIPDQARDRVHSEVYPLLGAQGCRVAIVGAGDAAFDYALNLSRHNEVMILIRGQRTRCLPLLARRVAERERIAVHHEIVVAQIEQEPGRDGLRLSCRRNTESLTIACDHLIFAIGREPQLNYLPSGWQEQAGTGRVYFAGDVANGFLRQTGIAVGDGLRAAMRIAATIKQNGES